MRIKELLRHAKLIIFSTAIAYVLCVSALFLYGAILAGPLGGWLFADHFLVRGPILRLMSPAMSDEEMIEHFQEKRYIFDDLVNISKRTCLTERSDKIPLEVARLVREADIISAREVGGAVWFPEPYSRKAFKQARALSTEMDSAFELLGDNLSADEKASIIGPLFESHRKHACKYRSIRFVQDKIAGSGGLSKGLQYFPATPRVDDGALYRPGIKSNGAFEIYAVVNSLNGLPNIWRDSRRCVYRKIEPKWFLFICPD